MMKIIKIYSFKSSYKSETPSITSDENDAWDTYTNFATARNFSAKEGVPKDMIEPLLRILNNNTILHFPGPENNRYCHRPERNETYVF